MDRRLTQPGASGGIVVEETAGVHLLRHSHHGTLTPADLGDLAHCLGTGGGVRVLAADLRLEPADAELSRVLRETLDELRASGTERLLLLMSGAGARGPQGEPALGRVVADGWNMRVTAPDREVLFVPGGSVFTPAVGDPATGGWRRFVPGAETVRLGPRLPGPRWQKHVQALPSRVPGGCVVDHIPAGVVVRPAEARAPEPGDLFHAMPADPRRPAVVVGVVDGEDVSANEVTALLAGVPDLVRSGIRLVPGGRTDVLGLAQGVASAFAAEIEVYTGLPLMRDLGAEADVARAVLVDADGVPGWQPFVDAVTCRPAAAGGSPGAEIRVTRWTSPLRGDADSRPGVTRLSDRWQVTATRAGLWIGPRGVPVSPVRQPVQADGPVLQVGADGLELDGSLWPCLSRTLMWLPRQTLAQVLIQVHGRCADGGRELRELAARHRLRGIRYEDTANRRALGTRPPSRVQPVIRAVVPGRTPRSTADDRRRFRELAAPVWHEQSAAALRAADRLPRFGEFGPRAEIEDLTALQLYLTSASGPWGHQALVTGLRAGRDDSASYAACLAAGLLWLPPHEGLVVRGAGVPGLPDGGMRPGAVLRERAPVVALPVASAEPLRGSTQYVIWSTGSRRVRFARRTGNSAGEVVFPPGAYFRILAVRQGRTGPLVLLREIGSSDAAAGRAGGGPDAPDGDVLARMDALVRGRPFTGASIWPDHCQGPPGTVVAVPPAPAVGTPVTQAPRPVPEPSGAGSVPELEARPGSTVSAARFQAGVRAAARHKDTSPAVLGLPAPPAGSDPETAGW
ncbi:hypothetical protein [Streptomyces sp. NPDC093970]|uniref:hypothetical protein n=1 Tax=Streptomyces sp. NPDC093970 TaxID=3155076 RepID=UPI0034398F05